MASDTIEIVTASSVLLAVTEAFVKRQEIPAAMGKAFPLVYGWLQSSGKLQVGHNYALYDQFSPSGMRMRVGFPISGAFEDTADVHCFELGGDRAAHARHTGDYSLLGQVSERLNQWIVDHQLAPAGESWEVYGDWDDDPSKLITDVYVRLV
ncbi:MAG: GyrI-like domain-containing protein [Proteobacteria bacterium]|nr:GyrI-like domain-containing protein [Pseudomonadota bacterium]